MVKPKDVQDFLDFLYCSSVLEEKTFLLYGNLAEKARMPLVKALLLHIAYDSAKHAAILQGIGKSIGNSKVKTKDCEKKLGETWGAINDLLRELTRKEKVQNGDLPSILGELRSLESTMGEEYYMLVELKTLQFMTNEIRERYNVDLVDLKDILEEMIKDEEKHTELLATVMKILSSPREKEKENTPVVRYQSPDSWVRPSE
jgi:rubrerythrin